MAGYDAYAQDYDRLVTSGVPVIELAYQWVLEQAGEVAGKAVLDLGCGQGELARRLCRLGAAVTGADASSAQLAIARERSAGLPIRWVQDDAQTLTSLAPGGFDLVVCSLVLMDVPDFQAAFAAAARVLAPGGSMLWVIMHPCFQAPHSEALADAEGRLRHRRIAQYASGWWQSGRPGTLRAALGAHHRTLAEYINGFGAAGFRLRHLDEPLVPPDVPLQPDQLCHHSIPPLLCAAGTRI